MQNISKPWMEKIYGKIVVRFTVLKHCVLSVVDTELIFYTQMHTYISVISEIEMNFPKVPSILQNATMLWNPATTVSRKYS